MSVSGENYDMLMGNMDKDKAGERTNNASPVQMQKQCFDKEPFSKLTQRAMVLKKRIEKNGQSNDLAQEGSELMKETFDYLMSQSGNILQDCAIMKIVCHTTNDLLPCWPQFCAPINGFAWIMCCL